MSDELTGQAVNAFVALKDGFDHSDQIKKDLILQVRKSIGPFAAPKAIFTVDDLPKTRSGKIMRRILRKILAGEEDQLGDTSTVSKDSNPPVAWQRSRASFLAFAGYPPDTHCISQAFFRTNSVANGY